MVPRMKTGARYGSGGRGRAASTRRVLRLWQFLEGRRYQPPVSDLAAELGVHPRTVKRDIALLEELYFPVPPPLPSRYFGARGAEVTRRSA